MTAFFHGAIFPEDFTVDPSTPVSVFFSSHVFKPRGWKRNGLFEPPGHCDRCISKTTPPPGPVTEDGCPPKWVITWCSTARRWQGPRFSFSLNSKLNIHPITLQDTTNVFLMILGQSRLRKCRKKLYPIKQPKCEKSWELQLCRPQGSGILFFLAPAKTISSVYKYWVWSSLRKYLHTTEIALVQDIFPPCFRQT